MLKKLLYTGVALAAAGGFFGMMGGEGFAYGLCLSGVIGICLSTARTAFLNLRKK